MHIVETDFEKIKKGWTFFLTYDTIVLVSIY